MSLDFRHVTLVAHDWGGPVGLGAMVLSPGRIERLCLGNTWAWSVNGDWHFEWFSRLLGGALGRVLARRFLIMINGVMRSSMRRRRLTRAELDAYRAPFRDRQRRVATHIFPREILKSRDWLAGLENDVRGFEGPVRFIWPEKDIAFRARELSRWRALLPQAEVVPIPRCGHFLWEDAPEEAIAALASFMETVT